MKEMMRRRRVPILLLAPCALFLFFETAVRVVIDLPVKTDFYGSMDAICDERFWIPWGVLNCGKGDPEQVARMTHGSAPARFRKINVHPGAK